MTPVRKHTGVPTAEMSQADALESCVEAESRFFHSRQVRRHRLYCLLRPLPCYPDHPVSIRGIRALSSIRGAHPPHPCRVCRKLWGSGFSPGLQAASQTGCSAADGSRHQPDLFRGMVGRSVPLARGRGPGHAERQLLHDYRAPYEPYFLPGLRPVRMSLQARIFTENRDQERALQQGASRAARCPAGSAHGRRNRPSR